MSKPAKGALCARPRRNVLVRRWALLSSWRKCLSPLLAVLPSFDSRFERFKSELRFWKRPSDVARDAEAPGLLTQTHRDLPSTRSLATGQSQPLARRSPRAGRNQVSWDSGPLEGRVLFACQEELHRADSAVGLDLRQRFRSLYSPRPKRLAEPIVMERLRLAVAYREAFGLDSLLSLQG